MNRYQHEVAEMDRRHHRLVRALSFFGASTLVALALWSAGLPAQWWSAMQRWRLSDEAVEQVGSAALVPPPQASLAADVADLRVRQNGGTDSSASPRPLFLVATAPGRNRKEGTARIGTNRANPQTYVGGALLANGARIAEIHRDHVVLERDGRRVELYLDTVAAKTRADDLTMVGGPPPPTPMPPVTREVLTDYMRPSPVFRDEELLGYQIYPGSRTGVFSQLGLRPGDVITAINDAPIADVSSGLELLKQFTNGTSIVVRIERDGKEERLVLDSTLITRDIEGGNSSAATPTIDLAGV